MLATFVLLIMPLLFLAAFMSLHALESIAVLGVTTPQHSRGSKGGELRHDDASAAFLRRVIQDEV